VDEVVARHILEHLEDIRKVMDELWRILKPEGHLTIYVPHFSHFQALTHPEHRHAFHYNSFQMFTPQSNERYTNRLWKIQRVRLHFSNRGSEWLFNRHKHLYTATILAYLFPAYEIEFVMTPLK
jgi:predicted SAM-dependent methyltransferase